MNNPLATLPLPPDTPESLASRFRLAERVGDDYVDAFMLEQPTLQLAMWVGDLIGAPESEWRCAIRKAGLGCSVYIYRKYSPLMQQIFEQRRKRLGY